jgi:hypothetical protein
MIKHISSFKVVKNINAYDTYLKCKSHHHLMNIQIQHTSIQHNFNTNSTQIQHK